MKPTDIELRVKYNGQEFLIRKIDWQSRLAYAEVPDNPEHYVTFCGTGFDDLRITYNLRYHTVQTYELVLNEVDNDGLKGHHADHIIMDEGVDDG